MTATDHSSRTPVGPVSQLPEPVHLDLGGVAVATYELAPRDGPARAEVVLCHGTPWSARVWTHLARALSAGHRVHLWDMPGYGLSAKGPEAPVDLESQMGHLARLVDHLGLERPHVVAHDIGGAVALGAHLLHGREFSSLMLWDAVVLDPWGSPFFRLVADHADVFSALPPALHRALVREYILGAAHRPLSTEALEMLVTPWITGEGQAAFYRQIAALHPGHTRPLVRALGTVRCPAAVGWGRQDPWVPVAQARALAEQLPGAPPPHLLADAGHFALLEAPDEVLAAVDAWLGTWT